MKKIWNWIKKYWTIALILKILWALLLLLVLNHFANAQQTTFDFKSIEVIDLEGKKVNKNTKTTFIYYPSGFTIISDEYKVYSFLVPGTEFNELKAVSFIDINQTIKLDTADTMNAIIYQSTIRPYQVAQLIGRDIIFLKKKDKSSIKFYNLVK